MVTIESGTRDASSPCQLLGARVVFEFVIGDKDGALGFKKAPILHALLCYVASFHGFIIVWRLKKYKSVLKCDKIGVRIK